MRGEAALGGGWGYFRQLPYAGRYRYSAWNWVSMVANELRRFGAICVHNTTVRAESAGCRSAGRESGIDDGEQSFSCGDGFGGIVSVGAEVSESGIRIIASLR